MNDSIDSGYSFTPKQQKKQSSIPFLVSEEVKKIISFNMTPFKENNHQEQIKTPITEGYDRKLQDAIKQLEIEELITDPIDFLCRNTTTNIICSLNLNTIQRSILFQLLSILVDGLVVIISYNYVLLKEKLRRIQDIVSWAAINPEVPNHQIEFIVKNISSRNIKLLIVHPEQANLIDLSNLDIKLLLLDQSNYYLSFTEIGKVQTDLTKFLAKANAEFIHILLPITQSVFIQDLRQSQPFNRTYQTYRESFSPKTQITCSKDESPIKSLISLLRSQRLYRKTGIAVFCHNISAVESVQFTLQQNGFKSNSIHQKKPESQRQASYYDFASQNIDIIVLPSGFQLPEGLKNFVYLSVHLYLPLNIETFILDISELNREANSHIFLCDEYYFTQRAELSSNFIQIENLAIFMQDCVYTNDLISKDENDISYWLTKKWLHLQNSEQSEVKIKKILLNESSLNYDFSKKQIQLFLQELEKEKWLEIQVSVPVELILSQLPEDEQIAQNVQIYGKKSGSLNGYKCAVDDLLKGSVMTPIQLINKLKQWKVKFEVSEEAQIIKLTHFPSQSELQAKVLDIYSDIKRQNIIRINNLDQMYTMARTGAFRSLEYMWKQIQLQKNSTQLTDFIQQYLDQTIYSDLTGHNNLPFIKLETQREKSTLLQDVKCIINHYNLVDFGLSWIQKENCSTKILVILQGLKTSKKELKSLHQWNKYRQYNYLKIHEMIHEQLEQLETKLMCQNKKKIKL
ncbi:unnamed protein product [Paramecium octaurelia]|uniref:Uncharacterized protein n=1 Tax=Paramecium octaurelia TaxID=43137 RepID=A0A8S1X2Y2_PAROT|nr:unnamed protein product [Paramecium octaurelia]